MGDIDTLNGTYRGYRYEGTERGAVTLYSPEGIAIDIVDDDEDVWFHVDAILGAE